ncbi:hypothetical protein Anapl_05768 [Anas platyrhynchos]|uniref:Uncharacterized protein n=1 Tax=Anas platyrhynchos TaxID=8839 RepID=R0M6T7_ANAPL|nr:hypothetical protein Anapl_05768 [Anas platyrhynchos]
MEASATAPAAAQLLPVALCRACRGCWAWPQQGQVPVTAVDQCPGWALLCLMWAASPCGRVAVPDGLGAAVGHLLPQEPGRRPPAAAARGALLFLSIPVSNSSGPLVPAVLPAQRPAPMASVRLLHQMHSCPFAPGGSWWVPSKGCTVAVPGGGGSSPGTRGGVPAAREYEEHCPNEEAEGWGQDAGSAEQNVLQPSRMAGLPRAPPARRDLLPAGGSGPAGEGRRLEVELPVQRCVMEERSLPGRRAAHTITSVREQA